MLTYIVSEVPSVRKDYCRNSGTFSVRTPCGDSGVVVYYSQVSAEEDNRDAEEDDRDAEEDNRSAEENRRRAKRKHRNMSLRRL